MIGAVVQIRMGSKRLPKKSMMKIGNKLLIQHVLETLKKCKKIKKIIVATTKNSEDDLIERWCNKNNYQVFRGPEDNVLLRYYKAAQENNLQFILRVTGDDPFKDFNLIDTAVDIMLNGDFDVVTNVFPPSYPEGLDIELLKFSCLETLVLSAFSEFEKEHVTQYIYKNFMQFKIYNMKNEIKQSHIRLTVDTKDDIKFLRKIDFFLSKIKKDYDYNDIINLLGEKPDLLKINSFVTKSTMYI